MRLGYLIVLLAAVAALAGGCGEGSDAETSEAPTGKPQQFRVVLNGKPRAENVGVIMAHTRGYFKEAGLDVIIHEPLMPARAFPYVADGIVDVGIVHQPELVLGQQGGASVVAVAGVTTQPNVAMIWLRKSKIESVADLEGKTIAIPGRAFEKGFLEMFLARGGLTLADVKVKTAEYNLLPALISGRADAIFGGSWNVEGAELEARGLDPVITRVESLGAPSYEDLVLITRRDRLAEDPESIQEFVAAMVRGTAEAVEDPRFAGEVVAYRNDKVPGKATKAEFEATLPLLSESGQISGEKASELIDWMYAQGLIERKPPASELFSNDYLEEPE